MDQRKQSIVAFANMASRRKSIVPGGRNRGPKASMVGNTLNLAKTKRKNYKVIVAPEIEEDDDDEPKEIIYTKPNFDCDKIYQLISDVVEKLFVVEPPEEEPEQGDMPTYDEIPTEKSEPKVEQKKMEKVYDPSENVNICQNVSKEIRDTLKTWRNLARYRIVVLSTVMEKQHQGCHYKMKYLVDPKTDNFVKYYYDSPNFYIIVCVILIFQD
ncbi:hypothetical protein PVAND_001067 [Polypedilum vanderplanki]|uniref:Dynein light chain n=1 Tax=Polypedilum vanderplanki TaxID=319348 RepID=A0A9J6BM83_POLVA|nr:hypothetical protein PVAND_001067 [Polypedilum vanderplanki]